jgi:hypothetical protein
MAAAVDTNNAHKLLSTTLSTTQQSVSVAANRAAEASSQ